ncbi:MAG: alpha/beta hydrolase [Anaerolineae bacterium]|nr:alpha/beta hydrolase [Anaerolineae bacterium]
MSKTTTWPDGYIEGNGLRLHYWRTGDGAKPPVVLCHGLSDNGLCWMPVARVLEADYDVIMPDARGHGLSDAPESGYTAEDQAADLAACIRGLALKGVAVLGHSMGGSTAAMATAQYPDLIAKALLEDPAWWDEDARERFMPTEEREEWLKGRRENILKQKRMSRGALIALCRKQSPAWADDELDNWAISKQQLSPNVVQGFAPPGPWQETAGKFRCPVLLITADVDKGAIVSPGLAAKATALNPRIRVAHISGAGHNVRREAFRAYMEAVTTFLLA